MLTLNSKTLFSTSFFDFQAGRDPQVVSWWIWLYWLVTILLTVAIHITWYFTSKRKENQINKAFGKRDEEIEAFGKRNEEMWSALVRGPAQDAAITARTLDEKAPERTGMEPAGSEAADTRTRRRSSNAARVSSMGSTSSDSLGLNGLFCQPTVDH